MARIQKFFVALWEEPYRWGVLGISFVLILLASLAMLPLADQAGLFPSRIPFAVSLGERYSVENLPFEAEFVPQCSLREGPSFGGDLYIHPPKGLEVVTISRRLVSRGHKVSLSPVLFEILVRGEAGEELASFDASQGCFKSPVREAQVRWYGASVCAPISAVSRLIVVAD